MKKLKTLALTGALALGGLGIGSMADLPIPGMQSQRASADADGIMAGETIIAKAGYVS